MKLLLALSILLNLVFGGMFIFRGTNSAVPTPPVQTQTLRPEAKARPVRAVRRTSPSANAQKATPSPHDWNGTTKELHALLRAAGAPQFVILDVLTSHARITHERKMQDLMGMNRWSATKKESPALSEQRKAQVVAVKTEVRELMGPDYERASLEMNPTRAVKWGNLSDQSLAAVVNLTQKYSEDLQKNRARYGMPNAATIDAEYEKAIRVALSPAEAEDFLTYNSGRALALQRELATAKITVDEDEYKTLLQVHNTIGATSGAPISNQMAEAYESIVGSERSLQLVSRNDASFRNIDGLLSALGHDATTRMSIYYDYQNALTASNSGKKTSEPLTRFYNRLADNIPPQELEAFRKSPKGSFLNKLRPSGN